MLQRALKYVVEDADTPEGGYTGILSIATAVRSWVRVDWGVGIG